MAVGFRSRSRTWPIADLGRLALRLALVAIVVAPISFWAVRKLSAPLAAFAAGRRARR
jgi:hypothetical protein